MTRFIRFGEVRRGDLNDKVRIHKNNSSNTWKKRGRKISVSLRYIAINVRCKDVIGKGGLGIRDLWEQVMLQLNLAYFTDLIGKNKNQIIMLRTAKQPRKSLMKYKKSIIGKVRGIVTTKCSCINRVGQGNLDSCFS